MVDGADITSPTGSPPMLTPVVTYLGPAHRLRPAALRGELVAVPSACATQPEALAR